MFDQPCSDFSKCGGSLKKTKVKKIEHCATTHVAIFQNLEAGLFSTWSLFWVGVGKVCFVQPKKTWKIEQHCGTPPTSRFKSWGPSFQAKPGVPSRPKIKFSNKIFLKFFPSSRKKHEKSNKHCKTTRLKIWILRYSQFPSKKVGKQNLKQFFS